MPEDANRPSPSSPEGAPDHALSLPLRRVPGLCGLSVPTLYREAGKGNIVLLKYGRTTLVDMASLRAFLAGLPRASIRPARKVV